MVDEFEFIDKQWGKLLSEKFCDNIFIVWTFAFYRFWEKKVRLNVPTSRVKESCLKPERKRQDWRRFSMRITGTVFTIVVPVMTALKVGNASVMLSISIHWNLIRFA